MLANHTPSHTTNATLSGHLVFPFNPRLMGDEHQLRSLIYGMVHSAAAITNHAARHEGTSHLPVGVDTILMDTFGQGFILNKDLSQIRIQLDEAVFNSAQAAFEFLEVLAYLTSNRRDINFDSCLLLQGWNPTLMRKDFVEITALSIPLALKEKVDGDEDMSLVPGQEFVAIKVINEPSGEEVSSRFYCHKM